MPKKKTYKEFKQEVESVKGYKLISKEYINNKTKVKIKHLVCGNIYEVRPDRWNQGDRCPKCNTGGGIVKHTLKEIQNSIQNLDNQYEILNKQYLNNKQKLTFLHKKCNKKFEMRFNDFQQGHRCPYCVGKNMKLTQKEFEKRILNTLGKDYLVLGDYINISTKIKIKHLKCGCIYEVAPNRVLYEKQFDRCPNCFKTIKKTTEIFKKEVYDLEKNEYQVLGEYKNAISKIKMKHLICNKEYYVRPNDFLQGYRCPYCKTSNGEKEINKILNKLNINHIWHYKNPDCKNIRTLEFDFRINIDDKKYFLLEYDGEFHEKNIFGDLEKQQKRDKIKNKFCQENNIKLYRIPYTDFDNLEDKLKEILIENNLLEE